MKPTLAFLQQKFDEYNRLIFSGQLPRVRFFESHAKRYLGQCITHHSRSRDGRSVLTEYRLRFSTVWDLPQAEWEDVLIHEMIHLSLNVNGLRDSTPHGTRFRSEMSRINRDYGRHVTISHRSLAPVGGRAASLPRAHVVAHVRMHNGRHGIKVLPRVEQRIVDYYARVFASPEVANVNLYMVRDAYFDRFPNSSALYVHFLPEDEILAHLEQAELMQCDGRRILRHYTSR